VIGEILAQVSGFLKSKVQLFENLKTPLKYNINIKNHLPISKHFENKNQPNKKRSHVHRMTFL